MCTANSGKRKPPDNKPGRLLSARPKVSCFVRKVTQPLCSQHLSVCFRMQMLWQGEHQTINQPGWGFMEQFLHHLLPAEATVDQAGCAGTETGFSLPPEKGFGCFFGKKLEVILLTFLGGRFLCRETRQVPRVLGKC